MRCCEGCIATNSETLPNIYVTISDGGLGAGSGKGMHKVGMGTGGWAALEISGDNLVLFVNLQQLRCNLTN